MLPYLEIINVEIPNDMPTYNIELKLLWLFIAEEPPKNVIEKMFKQVK